MIAGHGQWFAVIVFDSPHFADREIRGKTPVDAQVTDVVSQWGFHLDLTDFLDNRAHYVIMSPFAPVSVGWVITDYAPGRWEGLQRRVGALGAWLRSAGVA